MAQRQIFNFNRHFAILDIGIDDELELGLLREKPQCVKEAGLAQVEILDAHIEQTTGRVNEFLSLVLRGLATLSGRAGMSGREKKRTDKEDHQALVSYIWR